MTEKNEINDIISQLKEEKFSVEPAKKETPNVTDENVGEFVIQNAADVIQNSVELINDYRATVHTASEPDEISALSELIRATTGALDTLNRINIQNKRDKTAKELRSIESKQLPPSTGDTNILIATREEIFDRLNPLKQAEEKILSTIPDEDDDNEKYK